MAHQRNSYRAEPHKTFTLATWKQRRAALNESKHKKARQCGARVCVEGERKKETKRGARKAASEEEVKKKRTREGGKVGREGGDE